MDMLALILVKNRESDKIVGGGWFVHPADIDTFLEREFMVDSHGDDTYEVLVYWNRELADAMDTD